MRKDKSHISGLPYNHENNFPFLKKNFEFQKSFYALSKNYFFKKKTAVILPQDKVIVPRCHIGTHGRIFTPVNITTPVVIPDYCFTHGNSN